MFRHLLVFGLVVVMLGELSHSFFVPAGRVHLLPFLGHFRSSSGAHSGSTATASISISQSAPTSAETPTSVLAGGVSAVTYWLRTARMSGTCSGLRPTTKRFIFTTSRKLAPTADRAL